MARAPLNIEAQVELNERLPAPVEAAAYFVIAEGLTNVVRYAETRNAWVHISRQGGEVVVRVADDGKGGAAIEGGTGLRGLIDRLAVLDGHLEVTSPPGRGTRSWRASRASPARSSRRRRAHDPALLLLARPARLAGCGEVRNVREPDLVVRGDATAAAREAPDRQTRGVRIATARLVFITHGQASDEFWKVVQRGEQEAHKQTGAAVSYRSPDSFSLERMRRYIDEAVADHPDGMIVSLPDATALSPSIKAAVKAGIPVDHDQLRQRRVPQARRARPRRPGRVQGGLGEPGGGWAAPASRRALCVNQENGNIGLDQRCRGSATASPRPAAR